ncbi:MAG TPA: hemolysin family protein [Candidatus Akkermansia intestinigallinarum]|uniref:Hemolysin family protein n=1 Tax=Candidatus Akkermansia intestinigallinarum TaxID=2838431 RepID=A0A9D1VA99_9BACT|nr:hemolysin family protein [Candidatus Akkermansia intestinigallinarum]
MNIFLTQEEIAQLTWSYPTFGEIILFLLGTGFFLFLNAFFVANEFAAARVRESQLLEKEGETKAQVRRRKNTIRIVNHLDAYLSANQLGITIASLALGGLCEPFIEALIAPPLSYYCHLAPGVVSTISYIVAYTLFTFAHVVLGELVPKSLAIRHPLEVSLGTATAMVRFARIAAPVINLFNNTANIIAHRLFGVDPHYSPNNHHSAEEIAHIVEESGRSNEVTETEAEISMNALELNDRSVRDILVPRSSVELLDINTPFEKNLDIVTNSRHSRFPLVDGHLDKVCGWLHVKDMLKLVKMPQPDVRSVARELKVVPETMKLDTLLDFFSKEKTHFALVVDEYGDALGIVFLDDVLEEIVGDDIQDEFEAENTEDFMPTGRGEYIVNGSMALFDLEEALPKIGEIESDGGITTIGGYITDRLGHMPECGEEVRVKNYIFTVTGTDGRRVNQVRVQYAPVSDDDSEDDTPATPAPGACPLSS